MFKDVVADVCALSRRIMLMEEESKKSEQNLTQSLRTPPRMLTLFLRGLRLLRVLA
jgi:hypothetical protein